LHSATTRATYDGFTLATVAQIVAFWEVLRIGRLGTARHFICSPKHNIEARDSDGERSCQHHDEREQSAISGPSSKPWAQNMKCSKCGSLIVNGPAEKSALEIWQCEKCESEFAVHCHYLPDLSGIQARGLFTGTAFISSGAESLKALLKLKNKLAFAERFEPTKLEEQQRAGKLAWDIGYFLDFELERASAACVSAGVSVRFSEVN